MPTNRHNEVTAAERGTSTSGSLRPSQRDTTGLVIIQIHTFFIV